MALNDLLKISDSSQKVGLSEERIEAIIPVARNYVAYWRDYPDMFVDFLAKNCKSTFKFYFYQRVFMRVAARHKYVYATYPRACENAPNRNKELFLFPWTNFLN